MPERPAKRHILPRRWRIVVRVAITGAVLALVVLGVGIASDLLAPKPAPHVPATTITGAASDYSAGMAALSAGETTRAVELLTKAASEGSEPAKRQLASIPAAGPSSESSSPVQPSDYAAAIDDMARLLPTSVEGYRLTGIETATASAIVSGEPLDRTVRLTVQRAELSVLDRKTSSAAASWVRAISKGYPKHVSAVKVGDVDGRFGTDGARLASVAFSRGRYAFEVVLTVRRGDPNAQRDAVIAIAEAFAASHASQGQ